MRLNFETKSLEMRTFFERGYPTHLLDSAIQKAFNNSRRDKSDLPIFASYYAFVNVSLT